LSAAPGRTFSGFLNHEKARLAAIPQTGDVVVNKVSQQPRGKQIDQTIDQYTPNFVVVPDKYARPWGHFATGSVNNGPGNDVVPDHVIDASNLSASQKELEKIAGQHDRDYVRASRMPLAQRMRKLQRADTSYIKRISQSKQLARSNYAKLASAAIAAKRFVDKNIVSTYDGETIFPGVRDFISKNRDSKRQKIRAFRKPATKRNGRDDDNERYPKYYKS